MTDPLASSRYSIERAKQRLEEYEREQAVWINSKPYTTVQYPINVREEVVKVVLVKPPPAALPGIVFETATYLRSALDQAGHAVALAAGASGKSAHFPFGDTLEEVQSRAKTGSKELPKEVFDAMVALQPYKGGSNVLWGLNKLCNAGKHEGIVRTDLANVQRTMYVVEAHATRPLEVFPWDPVKNEMVLMTVARGSKCDIHIWGKMSLVIGNVQGVGGREVVTVLREMLKVVDGAVTDVEREAQRIGLFR